MTKNDLTSHYSRGSKHHKNVLSIDMFKIPEYQLSKEMKQMFKDLSKVYKKIDDKFL